MNWNIEDALRLVDGNMNPLYVWDNEKQKGHREEGLWKALEEMDVHLKDALFVATILANGIRRRTDWLMGRLQHIEADNRKAALDFVVKHQLEYQPDLALIWCYTACTQAEEYSVPINPEWISRLTLEVLTCTRSDWLKKGDHDLNSGWAVSAKKWLSEYLAR